MAASHMMEAKTVHSMDVNLFGENIPYRVTGQNKIPKSQHDVERYKSITS